VRVLVVAAPLRALFHRRSRRRRVPVGLVGQRLSAGATSTGSAGGVFSPRRGSGKRANRFAACRRLWHRTV